MIRLCYLVDSLEYGGTELNALRTLEAINREDFSPLVIHFHRVGPLLGRYADAAIPTLHFPLPGLARLDLPIRIVALARVLRAHDVHILHTQDVYSNILGVLAGRLARVPVAIASRRWLRQTPHHLLLRANRLVTRRATGVLANSEALATLVAQEDGVPRSRVQMVPNFVSDQILNVERHQLRAHARAALGIPKHLFPVLGIVARLSQVKRHDLLLEAFSRMQPQAARGLLVLVGEGTEESRLRALVSRFGMESRVLFTGTRTDSAQLHAAFDVSILCSDSEGFPNSVIEAMACGVPVIATRVGGTPEAVNHGHTGLLVPPGDPTALADAIAAMLADAGLRERMGTEGRRVAVDKYSRNAVLPRLEAWYHELLLLAIPR